MLTLREELFVAAYVGGAASGRALRAYEQAGFGGSAASRRANASRLLGKPRVAAAIAAAQEQKLNSLEKAGDEELAVVGDVAHFCVTDLFDANGKLIPIHELPRRIACAIRGMRSTKFGLQLEFRDSLKACEVLLRCAGRLKDASVHVEGPSLELILAQSHRLETTDAPLEARASLPAAPPDR
jgi:hypothetical protein